MCATYVESKMELKRNKFCRLSNNTQCVQKKNWNAIRCAIKRSPNLNQTLHKTGEAVLNVISFMLQHLAFQFF